MCELRAYRLSSLKRRTYVNLRSAVQSITLLYDQTQPRSLPKCNVRTLMLKAIFKKFTHCHRSPLLWLDTVTKLFDSDLVTEIHLSVEMISSLSEI